MLQVAHPTRLDRKLVLIFERIVFRARIGIMVDPE